MGFKCGIVGLPNVGKSTLFNALTASKNAEAANFPFCTIDPNIGIVDVIDERLDQLAKLSSSKSEIRRMIKNNGLKINNEIFSDATKKIDKNSFDNNNNIKVSHGKKQHVIIKII